MRATFFGLVTAALLASASGCEQSASRGRYATSDGDHDGTGGATSSSSSGGGAGGAGGATSSSSSSGGGAGGAGGAGSECLVPQDCPDPGNVCLVRVCDASVCGTKPVAVGTAIAEQKDGDCKRNQCDGAGQIVTINDNADLPEDNNECTADTCASGAPTFPNVAAGTPCSQNGGTQCNAAGACVAPGSTPTHVMVLRVGTGVGALSSAATAAFMERLDVASGMNAGTIALPTAPNGQSRMLTLAGSATAEGFISRSADGKYVVVGGYDAAPGTAAVASTGVATVNRIIGRIDAMGNVDTTTRINDAFNAGNIRGAATADGTLLWATGSNAGVVYVPFGNTSPSTTVANNVINIRAVAVFGGQLYISSTSGADVGVLAVGAGTPTTSGKTAVLLPGLVGSPGTNGFVFLDRDPAVPGNDTVYIADDRTTANGGGVQKWTFNGAAWTLAATINAGLTTGTRGIAGFLVGDEAILFVSTTESGANKLVRIVDPAIGAPTGSLLATAAANTVFRGVALAPQ